MKLYNSIGPNPQVVRTFAAERGIDLAAQGIDIVQIDIRQGENRQPEYLAKNSLGSTPALELDDGTVISEITAICEYFDDQFGASDLIGKTPLQRALTRMWMRRIDQHIMEPMINGFRYSEGRRMFEPRMTLIPHAAADLKALAQEKLTWLDQQMQGRQWICGDRFSLADIMLYAFLAFGAQAGQPLNEANANICAWYERVKARPASSA